MTPAGYWRCCKPFSDDRDGEEAAEQCTQNQGMHVDAKDMLCVYILVSTNISIWTAFRPFVRTNLVPKFVWSSRFQFESVFLVPVRSYFMVTSNMQRVIICSCVLVEAFRVLILVTMILICQWYEQHV